MNKSPTWLDLLPSLNLEDLERAVILKALAVYGGHRGRAAEALGVSYRGLIMTLARLRLEGADVPPATRGGRRPKGAKASGPRRREPDWVRVARETERLIAKREAGRG